LTLQGESRRIYGVPTSGLIFGLLAVTAAALSLTVLILALRDDSVTPAEPALSVTEELAARNERIAFFETRLVNDPIDIVSLNALAAQYLQRARETGDVGDYQRAEVAASRSLAVVPGDNHSALSSLASVRLVQHDFAEALALSDRAIANRPDLATGYALRGDALVGLGRYDEADASYQQMLVKGPDLTSFSRLATLAFIRGDAINAEDFWRQALDPRQNAGLPIENIAWAHSQFGATLFARGDLKGAEREYGTSLRLYPDYVHGTAGLAAVRAAQASYDDAVRLYNEAQQRLPQLPYMVALVDVLKKAGREDDAVTQTELIGAIDGLYQSTGINTDLAFAAFYADHGRPAEALVLAQNAYRDSPSVYAADALAWALYRNGDVAEAWRFSEESLRLKTPEALFHYHAGVIASAMGDRAGAVDALTTALSINPYFSLLFADEARALLADLKSSR
jgi:tetratricopeptide (TPR) repeat protein